MPPERNNQQEQGEILQTLLPRAVSDPETKALLEGYGVEPSFRNAICLAALRKAAAGDMTAYRTVRDVLAPAERAQTPVSVRALDLTALTDEELEHLADELEDAP